MLNNSFQIIPLHRHRSQRSSTVYLRSGRAYFIEALMIDAGGPDHLSVGVRLPGGRFQRPISRNNLYIIPPGKLHVSFNKECHLCFNKFSTF